MSEFLLQVDAETVLHGGLQGMSADFRTRRFARQKIVDRLAVDAHVGVVHKRQQAHRGRPICNQPRVKFEFEVFRAGATQIPVQVGAVRHLGHQGLAEAKRPVAVVIFGDHADGVAAGVGGIVVGAVVVDGPVHELGMTVAATVVEVEEVSHSELARAQFQATDRQAGSQGERSALGSLPFRAERDNLSNHGPRQVGSSVQVADCAPHRRLQILRGPARR